MTILRICSETEELGGGRFRLTQHLRPIAYDDAGTLRRIVSDWGDSGIQERPTSSRPAG